MSSRNSVWHKATKELGIRTLVQCSRDVYILLLARVVRMMAYGSSTLILALHLAALGCSDTKIGLFMTLTLLGDVAISLLLTTVADALGRRRIFVLGALLMTCSGAVFAVSSNYWILLTAAVLGVISPSGNEIGPFKAIEESTIAHLTSADTRVDVFAWYTVFGTFGTAGGTLLCGWLTQWLQTFGWDVVAAYRLVFWIYAAIGLVKTGLGLLLSPACEMEEAKKPEQIKLRKATLSPGSRSILIKLCGLFFFDSLASGMVPLSLIAFFMERKFGMNRGTLGTIMSAASFVSSIGNIFAASIARRIGLVKTMVLTHLPSAILLALVPFPNALWLSATFLIARALLSSMDQAPRSALLAAVVLPEERTMTMGYVNTVKTMSQSGGPLITSTLAAYGAFWLGFVIAGTLKGSYDLGLLALSRGIKLEGESLQPQAEYQAVPLDDEPDTHGNGRVHSHPAANESGHVQDAEHV